MEKKASKLKFPKGFYWGAAISAHQVEGGNHNDWTEWEKENSARFAKEALNKSYPNYVLNDYPGPLRRENYISGRACDHYNRYEEDFDLAKSLAHNAHRFSIEWSRIEPEEGRFNEKEIEHYRKVALALKSRDIEPFVTLWHWTLPVWFAEKKGFLKKNNIEYFTRYAELMARSLPEVRFWFSLNEPLFYAGNAYFKGVWPSNNRSFIKYVKVLKNLTLAHKKSYEAIKKINPLAQVGIAKNNIYFEGRGLSAVLANVADWWWNERFLDDIKEYQDFIGLNYYFHNKIKGFKFTPPKVWLNQNENSKTSDMGWEIYPEGIYKILQNLAKYEKPIFITENGLADAKDSQRTWFIAEHLKWVVKAIKEGVDVKGYFYWSLLDNFEWDKGFWPRFGLIEVDYKTLERKIRKSGLNYRDIILGKDSI